MTSRSRTAGSAVASILATCSWRPAPPVAAPPRPPPRHRPPRRARRPRARGAGSGCPTSQPAALARRRDADRHDQTDKGAIAITVDADLSPIAAGNFVALADAATTTASCSIASSPGFVIQGGDGIRRRRLDRARRTGGPGYTIQDEPVTTPYERGTVAMARTVGPNTVGSQFFIVLDDSAAAVLSSAEHLPDHRHGDVAAWTPSTRSPRPPTPELPSEPGRDGRR